MKSMKRLWIITGASRGLGRSLLENALNQGDAVIALNRSKMEKRELLWNVSADLSRPQKAIAALERLLGKFKLSGFSEIHLIHNAALLEPICKITKARAADLESHFQVNLMAPLWLSKWFVERTAKLRAPRSIVFISSGAAHFVIPNWTAYCTTKAGLRMMADCLSAEKLHPQLRVLSFSPGLMDTQMQKQIRGKKSADFPLVDNFVDYQKKGQLVATDLVARGLYDLVLHRERFPEVHYAFVEGQVVTDRG